MVLSEFNNSKVTAVVKNVAYHPELCFLLA